MTLKIKSHYILSLLFLNVIIIGFNDSHEIYYLRFKGFLYRDDYVFKIDFINDSEIFTRKVDFNITIIKKDNIYNFSISIIIGSSIKQVCVNAFKRNGRLFVGDTPTIFIVEPSIFKRKIGLIYITSCLEWKVFGEILRVGRFPTAINDCRVEAISITAYHYRDNIKAMPMNLAYELDEGFLVHFSGVISDPLLLKMGIKHIWGGEWRLKNYSNNINLKLISPKSIDFSPVLFIFTLIFISMFMTFYIKMRRRNR